MQLGVAGITLMAETYVRDSMSPSGAAVQANTFLQANKKFKACIQYGGYFVR